jgi:hypothetical protein
MSNGGEPLLVRILRWVAVVAMVTFAVLVAWPDAAGAHGVATLTIHGDGRGSVWVTARWDDGHPITESMAATAIATSKAGQRVGPVPLKPLHDSAGTLAFGDPLAAGDWQVVADLAAPALGHCAASVAVAAPGQPAASPTETRCASSAPPGTASSGAQRDVRKVTLYVVGGGLLVALLVAVIGYFTRPPRPAPVPSRRRR